MTPQTPERTREELEATIKKLREALEFVKNDPNTVNPHAHMVIDEALAEGEGKG